jgi:Fur family transcriptional regulator, ferric uptake regulator
MSQRGERRGHTVPDRVHDAIADRLATLDQRYTSKRRVLVEALGQADRPLGVPEILDAAPGLPQSSAYRILSVLLEAGVIHRVVGTDEFARYELDEAVGGPDHHHHLLCTSCGSVTDVEASSRLERALAAASKAAAADADFEVTDHRFDLVGHCAACR